MFAVLWPLYKYMLSLSIEVYGGILFLSISMLVCYKQFKDKFMTQQVFHFVDTET